MDEPQPAIKLGTSLTRRFGQVVEKYEKLIQLGQSDVQLYHNLADCYIKLGRFSANEEKTLQKVLDLEPDNQEVVSFLLQNYLQRSRKDTAALHIYEKCFPQDPKNLQLLGLMEAAYIAIGPGSQVEKAHQITRALAEAAHDKGEFDIAVDKYVDLLKSGKLEEALVKRVAALHLRLEKAFDDLELVNPTEQAHRLAGYLMQLEQALPSLHFKNPNHYLKALHWSLDAKRREQSRWACEAYLKEGEITQEITGLLEQFLQIQVDHMPTLIALTNFYYRDALREKAQEKYQTLMKHHGSRLDPLQLIGSLDFVKSQKHVEALAFFLEAGDTKTSQWACEACLQHGEITQETVTLFERFLTLVPRHLPTLWHVGEFYYRTGAVAETLKKFAAVLELDAVQSEKMIPYLLSWTAQYPDDPRIFLFLSERYLQQNNIPLALDNLKQAHGLDPTLRDRIIPRLTRMKTLAPSNVEIRYFLARLYHEQGALSQEVEEYEALYQYEAEKEHARAALIPLLSTYLQANVDVRRHVLLGQLLREEGRLAEAKGALVTAREQAVQHKEQGLLRDAKYILGICFADEGFYEAAAEEIGEVVAGLTVSTETVDRFYELAQAYEKAGQYEPARRTYNTILRFRPDYRDVESRVRTVSTRSNPPAVAEPRQPPPALVESIGDWATMYSQQEVGRKRYEIGRQLGQGGMGIIYEAYDTEMRTRVALKVISPVLNRNRRVLENFIREAQMTFKLNHPNIVRIHNRGEEMGQHYIAMEYVAGITLRDLLIQREKLSLDEVLRLADGICQGLQYAHTFIDPDSRRKTPVIHRDLKPENVILAGVTEQEPYVTPQTIPKILDFGLSRVLTDTQLSSGSLAKGVSGTYGYMPPEQFDRIKVADERADIYSLGVTVYELLTGGRPFEGDSPAQLMFATLHREPLPPSEHDAAIPAWLDAVILKCLAKSPEARYQSAAALQQALSRDRVQGTAEVYRELVHMLYRNDLHLDESERLLLEAKRQQLGMSEAEARQIEEEVARRFPIS